ALDDPEPMGDEAGAAVLRVHDLAAPLAAREDAGVADLSARLRVERRAVEDDLYLVARDRLAAPPAVRNHRENPRRRGHRLVAEDLSLGGAGQEGRVARAAVAPRPAERRARAGALALRLHLLVVLDIGLGSGREAQLLELVLGEINRETVCVVEGE